MAEEHIDWKAKVDHRLRALIDRTVSVEEAGRPIQVLIRVAKECDFASLAVPGLQLGSIAGDIATATVTIRDISLVASASKILFVELSGSYSPDDDLGAGTRRIGPADNEMENSSSVQGGDA